jgi:hypothetical protein
MAESMKTHRAVIDWQSQSDEGLRIRCGGMTPQEIRTVRDVLLSIVGKGTHDDSQRIVITLAITDPEVVADYRNVCDELVWEDLVNGELINFAEFVSLTHHPPSITPNQERRSSGLHGATCSQLPEPAHERQ